MNLISLNRNELETLRILWERDELKPAEIQSAFAWPIENATLRSVLLNLVEKGHATRQQRGKAFFYAARVRKATLLQAMMRSLAQVFAGGSHQELVAQLVETGDLEPADLKLLSETASGRRRKNERKPK